MEKPSQELHFKTPAEVLGALSPFVNKPSRARRQRLAPQLGKHISLRSVKKKKAPFFILFFLVSFLGPARSLNEGCAALPGSELQAGHCRSLPAGPGRAVRGPSGRGREVPGGEATPGRGCAGLCRPRGPGPAPRLSGGLEPGSAPPIPDKRGWSQHTPYLDSFSSVAHQHANCCMTNYALNSS